MLLVNIHKKPTIIPIFKSLNPFAEEFQMPAKNVLLSATNENLVVALRNDLSLETLKPNQTIDVEQKSLQSVASNAFEPKHFANEKPLNGCIPKIPFNGVNHFTKEELEVWHDLPVSITNPMKAIMGYAPTDDERICKFYNPKTGKCFKGNNCSFEHVQIMKGKQTIAIPLRVLTKFILSIQYILYRRMDPRSMQGKEENFRNSNDSKGRHNRLYHTIARDQCGSVLRVCTVRLSLWSENDTETIEITYEYTAQSWKIWIASQSSRYNKFYHWRLAIPKQLELISFLFTQKYSI